MTYPNDSGVYSAETLGYSPPVINYQYYPLIWNVDDKDFLVWMQRGGTPYNNEDMVLVYDHYRKKISDSFAWGEINPPNDDVHLQAALMATDDKKLLVLAENPHNGACYIKKSGANYDISTYTTHGSFGTLFAYPHIHKFTNGDLYLIYRKNSGGSAIGHKSEHGIYKSTDNGENWTDLGLIMTLVNEAGGNDNLEWAYPLTPFFNGDKIGVFLNRRRGYLPWSMPSLYYYETIDGINWHNAGEGHTQSATITEANLDDYYRVFQYGDGSYQTGKVIRASGACFVGDNPYAIGGDGSDNVLPTLYYFDGSNWQHKAITCSGHTLLPFIASATGNPNSNAFNNACPMIYNNGYLYAYMIEQVSGYGQASLFRTNDDGTTWEYVKQITSGNYDYMDIHISGNYAATGKGIVAIGRKTTTTYGDLWIEKITL